MNGPRSFTIAKTIGQVAYEAHADSRNWLAEDGSPMPQWDCTGEGTRAAWEAVAVAAVERFNSLAAEAEREARNAKLQ